MSIPTRGEAARILLALRPPDWLIQHSVVVADAAGFLARKIQQHGHTIDAPLVLAAALLHDLDKALPADDPLRGLGHADAGAEWLRKHGHAELARAVAGHPVMRLAEDERYQLWVRDATVEERVVAYADKRALQELVSLDERFGYWIRRYGSSEAMDVARERADRLEAEICAAAGIRPEDVDREPWAEAELRAAA